MKARKGYTATELIESESTNTPLIQEKISTNVKVQACDVEKEMWPQYDLFDGRKSTVLALSLPGYHAQRVSIELQGATLSVSVYDDGCTGYYNSLNGPLELKRKGIRTGAFARVFDVDDDCELGRMWKEDGVFFIELVRNRKR